MAQATSGAARVQEPERRPLLNRAMYSYGAEDGPSFSCTPNPHSHLPVYTTIHRIRRDVISIVEDYLTFEQLGDLRLNVSVVRPLVDKLYELGDISIGKTFLCPQSTAPVLTDVDIGQCIACS